MDNYEKGMRRRNNLIMACRKNGHSYLEKMKFTSIGIEICCIIGGAIEYTYIFDDNNFELDIMKSCEFYELEKSKTPPDMPFDEATAENYHCTACGALEEVDCCCTENDEE